MKKELMALFSGFVFSLGLGISGMTQPQKVIGFLDLWNWQPDLLFVMLGAVGTHMILYRIIRKRKSPIFDLNWHIPDKKEITPQLIVGAAIFGLGWGLSGFCPGPAVTSLASGEIRVFVFIAMMVVGMFISLKLRGVLK